MIIKIIFLKHVMNKYDQCTSTLLCSGDLISFIQYKIFFVMGWKSMKFISKFNYVNDKRFIQSYYITLILRTRGRKLFPSLKTFT